MQGGNNAVGGIVMLQDARPMEGARDMFEVHSLEHKAIRVR